MAETWYEVPMMYGWEIKPVDVTRVTDLSVWIGGRARRRDTVDTKYVKTLAEAERLIKERAVQRKAGLERDLAEVNHLLSTLKHVKL